MPGLLQYSHNRVQLGHPAHVRTILVCAFVVAVFVGALVGALVHDGLEQLENEGHDWLHIARHNANTSGSPTNGRQ